MTFYTVTIHTAGRMYRQTRHGTRPRLGLEFAHGRACASLLTFFIHTAGRVYNISRHFNTTLSTVSSDYKL